MLAISTRHIESFATFNGPRSVHELRFKPMFTFAPGRDPVDVDLYWLPAQQQTKPGET